MLHVLRVRRGKRYRDASPTEIFEAAQSLLVAETRGTTITTPAETANLCRQLWGGYEHERFGVLWLDTRHRLIDSETLFVGTIDGAAVYPRVVVKRALEVNAGAAIFAHNHPSGDAEPSETDKSITRRLLQALALIDVRLLDHLVVTRDASVSLAERGWVSDAHRF